MAIAFGMGGVAYWLLGSLGTAPWAFVMFAAMIFLTWGEIFSLFPFHLHRHDSEPKFATVNLSLLYTAKGDLGLPRSPAANIIKTGTGVLHSPRECSLAAGCDDSLFGRAALALLPEGHVP